MLKLLFSFFMCMTISAFARGQQFDVPPKLPATAEEYKDGEPTFINFAKWLEQNPIGKIYTDSLFINSYMHRVQIMTWMTAWLLNPAIRPITHQPIIDALNKNPELQFVWTTAFIRFRLENNYSTDSTKATIEGLRSVINCYRKGTEFVRDEVIVELLKAEAEGKLENWVEKILFFKQ